MKKVIIKNSINVDVMIEKMKSEIECLNNGYEYDMIKDYIIKNGSGIYEFGFGCRGGLEEFIKNDEYLSIEEVNEVYYDNECSIEEVGMYYSDDYNFINEDFDFIFCVSYFEEGSSVFVNVSV